MRIFAGIIWFDENPRWLAATIASVARIADHVVAVDGAFLHYPEGRPSSGGEQAETIHAVATANGLGCTIHTPQTVWMGNEVEKRNTLLGLVQAIATPHQDWFFTIDGDEEITQVSGLTRADLAATERNAALVGFWTTDEIHSWYGPTRRFYRVLERMEYGPTHFTVAGTTATGERVLVNGRGPEWDETYEPALDLTSQIRVEHKHHLRDQNREARAKVFAHARVDFNLEGWGVPVAEEHGDATSIAVPPTPD